MEDYIERNIEGNVEAIGGYKVAYRVVLLPAAAGRHIGRRSWKGIWRGRLVGEWGSSMG